MSAATLPAPDEPADPDTGKLGMWVFLASEVLFFGGLSKLCVGGGERVCHSRPLAAHGLAPARAPWRSDQAR